MLANCCFTSGLYLQGVSRLWSGEVRRGKRNCMPILTNKRWEEDTDHYKGARSCVWSSMMTAWMTSSGPPWQQMVEYKQKQQWCARTPAVDSTISSPTAISLISRVRMYSFTVTCPGLYYLARTKTARPPPLFLPLCFPLWPRMSLKPANSSRLAGICPSTHVSVKQNKRSVILSWLF